MINIFNLFLFLLTLWLSFMVVSGNVSVIYVIFGILASGLVSIASFRLKLIEKKSELLYLSLGFYRHFFRVFFTNFFTSIKLIFNLALASQPIKPLLYNVEIDEKNQFNPALLIVSFNMTSGLFCVGVKENEMLVHAIDSRYFARFNLSKTCAALEKANDDNLV